MFKVSLKYVREHWYAIRNIGKQKKAKKGLRVGNEESSRNERAKKGEKNKRLKQRN